MSLDATARSAATISGRRLVFGGVLLAIAMVLAMTGSAVLLASADEPSADDVLRRAQRFVARHDSVAFTRRTHVEVTEGDVPAGFFADSTGEGVADFGGERYRLLERVGPARTEVILVDGERFVRGVESGSIDDELYSLAPDPEKDLAREGVFGGSLAESLGPTPGEPHRLDDLIAAARSPRLVASAERRDRGDGDAEVVRAKVSLVTLDESKGIRRAVVELTVATSGRVDRAVIEIEAEGASVEHDYEPTGWGESVTVTAPSEDEIDSTPGIDEEALEAFDEVQLVQPRGIPERWVLDAAFVLSEEESGAGCEQVEIDYIDPDDEERGFLSLYESGEECAPSKPRGSEIFRAGSSTGWVMEAEGPDAVTSGFLLAGRTAIAFETDLPLAELTVVLADLSPFDPEVAPSPIGGIGRARAAA